MVAKEVHKRYPEADGRIRFGKVDCTQEVAMCREYHITGFPSIRVFRKGSDDITVHGVKEHESYRGQCFSQPFFTHPLDTNICRNILLVVCRLFRSC